MITRVLLVEPDASFRAVIHETVRPLADVDSCADFQAARAHLFEHPYGLLVTRLRLHAYNGLHLVHLAMTRNLSMTCLAYGDDRDLALAKDAQSAGAFYESRQHLRFVIPAYVCGLLPPKDRRNPGTRDRRVSNFRGGRRVTDAPADPGGLEMLPGA